MENEKLIASPQEYLDDIVKITCLIIRDGEEYRFIHLTVQEYYTSSLFVGDLRLGQNDLFQIFEFYNAYYLEQGVRILIRNRYISF